MKSILAAAAIAFLPMTVSAQDMTLAEFTAMTMVADRNCDGIDLSNDIYEKAVAAVAIQSNVSVSVAAEYLVSLAEELQKAVYQKSGIDAFCTAYVNYVNSLGD